MEQEKCVTEKWLPELRTAVASAQKSLEDCKYVRGLVSDSNGYIALYFPVTCSFLFVLLLYNSSYYSLLSALIV